MSDDVRTRDELAEATTSGVRWITFARLVTEITLIGSMVVLARLIPPSAFGMFAIAVLVQELAVNIPTEGFGTAVVQRRTIGREHLEGGFAICLIIGAALSCVALVLALVLVKPIFGAPTAQLIALITPVFLLAALMAMPLAVLRRRLDFRRLSIVDLAQNVARAVVSIGLAAFAGLDAGALVIGSLASVTTAGLLAWFFAPVPLPRWRGQAVRELLPYGGPAGLACFAWTGFRNGDYAIVGAKLGSATAGVYWRGFQLAVEYQRKISTVMTQIAFPVLARTADATEMFAMRQRMARLLAVTIFPLLSLLVILAPAAVPWVFGPQWESAVMPTQILVVAGAATVVIDAVGSVLSAEGRARALLGYGIAHFVAYAGAVLLVASHGIAAVAVAASTVHTIFLVVAYQLLVKGREESALKLLWGDISAALVGSAALFAAALPVDLALVHAGAPAPVQIVLVCPVAAVAYLGALRLWFPAAWGDVMSLARRVLPLDRLNGVRRRTPVGEAA